MPLTVAPRSTTASPSSSFGPPGPGPFGVCDSTLGNVQCGSPAFSQTRVAVSAEAAGGHERARIAAKDGRALTPLRRIANAALSD
jgi:hypothetical protein